MNLKNETLHRLEAQTENSCTESHIVLDPPYIENGETYSLFKIFQNTGDAIYVTDDLDCGVTLKLKPIHTETDEMLSVIDDSSKEGALPTLLNIKVYEVKKYLPSIVSLERISRLPNKILFKDHTDLTLEE